MEIPFGHVENNTLFRSAFGDTAALKLKEVKEDEIDDSVTFYTARYDQLKLKLDEIENKINSSQNKGSFLSSLVNLKESILTHDGLGDYQQLMDRIAPLESLLTDYVQKNRQKNTEIKRALLLELDAILENNDQEEAFEQIKDLKLRWLKTGMPEQSVRAELEDKFKSLVDGFFEKRNAFNEDKQILVKARMDEYQAIVAEIKSFVDNKDFQNHTERVKALQKQWKEVGRVPEKDFKAVNEKYWKLTQEYFTKQKKQRNADLKNRRLDEKESLKQKTSILDELKALVENGFSKDQKAFEALKTKWKNSGHVSKKKHPEVHDSFMKLSREWQERRFVLDLTRKRNKGFAQKPEKDQLKDLTRVVRDLLNRDENELKSFRENMDKMHINKGSFVDMLEDKLQAQQEKVELKKALLKECQQKIKQL